MTRPQRQKTEYAKWVLYKEDDFGRVYMRQDGWTLEPIRYLLKKRCGFTQFWRDVTKGGRDG